jgi:hypothetical protein
MFSGRKPRMNAGWTRILRGQEEGAQEEKAVGGWRRESCG